jgi:predicted transcriptional regulator
MGKRISEEQKQKIRELVAEGNYTQKEIAEQVGCSTVAVGKYGKEEVEEEVEDDSAEVEQISGTSVEDFYEKILDAKDEHIKDMKELNLKLLAVLSGKPLSTDVTL